MTDGGFQPVLRPSDAAPDVAGDRTCGTCTLCCTVLRVDALKKLGGVACAQLRPVAEGSAGGCGIYPDRPRICRTYRCLWLQGGLEEEDRPDRLDAVLDLVSTAGSVRLAVRERVPGAVDQNPRLRAIVERYRSSTPVRVSNVHDVMNPSAPVRILLPGGEEHRLDGDIRTEWRDGRQVRTDRLPFTERAFRRIILLWRRLRLRGFGDGSGAAR